MLDMAWGLHKQSLAAYYQPVVKTVLQQSQYSIVQFTHDLFNIIMIIIIIMSIFGSQWT